MIRKFIDIAELRNAIENGLKTVPIYEVDVERIADRISIIEERPRGKWIRGNINDDNVWYCSNCRHIDDYYGPTANYCWYCGADMRGDKE